MRMNAFGRLLLNNPARSRAQRHWILPMMARLGGSVEGCRVLEIGCGRGVGAQLLLDHFGAATVDAVDLDPVMVRLATRRLGGRAQVRLADVTDLASLTDATSLTDPTDLASLTDLADGKPMPGLRSGFRPDDALVQAPTVIPVRDDRYDVVVDFGALHLEPRWRGALSEIHRVLRPQGRFCFEEIVRPTRQALVPLATGLPIPAAPTEATLVEALRHAGFETVELARPGFALLTGMVGDLVGVASAG